MSAAAVKEQFEIAKQGLKAIRDKNSVARQAAEQGNQAIINEINDINAKIAQIKELVARSNELDSALKAKEEELEKLVKEKGDLNGEFDTLKQERDALQGKLAETEENLNGVNAIITTRDDEAREKENALEELGRQNREEREKLEKVNADLQDLLGDITEVNREINETGGEVQTLHEYNDKTVGDIKLLLQKVNSDLQDILNMPKPPASRMQQIHEQRVSSRSENNDVLEEGTLSNMFDQPAAQQAPPTPALQAPEDNIDDTWRDSDGEDEPEPAASTQSIETDVFDNIAPPMTPQEKALSEAESQPWWITLTDQEKAQYGRVPENRAFLRVEGKKRLEETQEARNDNRAPPEAPRKKQIYLTEWKNMMTPEEMQVFDKDPSRRDELEAEGKRRLQEKKKVGGRSTRRRGGRMYKHKSNTRKKGGYVAMYKKSSRRSKSKSSKSKKSTRSKRSSRSSSKGKKSRKH